ncbi:hypothetical protein HanRHA438_Chr05g0213851 [Helianthus annuus]|uniref:Uncharacterized protein n=1 Tax=Helianthus annuus TaxID=4232 RepID=A0A9K3IYB0_HELAN|nr:hypothetical protein HanXRQr2_Chr05g0203981 [Helianthus annuus]KAJ0569551.1 hypothetical protein HanHA300_Chr05g0167491 [Helianthus annuus]KAJ0583862.1 hypothetical protein HanHA89_Chr05g0181561 [Helianthus annuus]KAJ0918112.1 hypothetical protein HanRHA438_Chr05g0213851 [Helianthus annuus]KAJ0921877.1 hypothetical protein HanPSC8_Chr05g0196821 [Helianthus annuus]
MSSLHVLTFEYKWMLTKSFTIVVIMAAAAAAGLIKFGIDFSSFLKADLVHFAKFEATQDHFILM